MPTPRPLCCLCGVEPALWSFPASELVAVPVHLCPGCTGRQTRGSDGRLSYGLDVAARLHARADRFVPVINETETSNPRTH